MPFRKMKRVSCVYMAEANALPVTGSGPTVLADTSIAGNAPTTPSATSTTTARVPASSSASAVIATRVAVGTCPRLAAAALMAVATAAPSVDVWSSVMTTSAPSPARPSANPAGTWTPAARKPSRMSRAMSSGSVYAVTDRAESSSSAAKSAEAGVPSSSISPTGSAAVPPPKAVPMISMRADGIRIVVNRVMRSRRKRRISRAAIASAVVIGRSPSGSRAAR